MRKCAKVAIGSVAAVVEGINVYPVASQLDVLNTQLLGVIQSEPHRISTEELLGELQHFSFDFKDDRGQQTAKDALESPLPATTTSL